MSAPVLLNLLKELRKINKKPGWLSILLHFCNKFNKFKIVLSMTLTLL